jgi:hypothetical protein
MEERFFAFHYANPWVLDRLADLARTLLRRGWHKIGIGLLTEQLRWTWATTTEDPNSEWKLNNDYRAFYVRLLEHTWPDEFAGVFEKRRSHADEMVMV